MKLTHYDVGYMERGEVVQVGLADNAANVRLLDRSNFQVFKVGRQHRYYGGYANRRLVMRVLMTSGFVVGPFCLRLWWRNRPSASACVATIRDRLPPEWLDGAPRDSSPANDLKTKAAGREWRAAVARQLISMIFGYSRIGFVQQLLHKSLGRNRASSACTASTTRRSEAT